MDDFGNLVFCDGFQPVTVALYENLYYLLLPFNVVVCLNVQIV